MKKATLSTIYSFLTGKGNPPEESLAMAIAEVEKELTKGDAEKVKNAELYEDAKPIIFGALSETPVTIGELYEEVKDALPEGFSKGKMQYAITRLWVDEVTKTEGKVNAYSRKG